ncbi:SCO family protein [Chondrinema litorale]|uniref:SCO family protein n=1 Tax=Chondrinema litorale TaxID=2994555 RepID=UPI002542825F|nr:SCO family protein [Chondrinema litorale]UZR98719.1 SCO family protein [Chondrinema litorale]
MKLIKAFFFFTFILSACSPSGNNKLPILGQVADAQFEFLSQDSAVVTPQTFENKIYVTDFFFTTCPTICPKMKAQMLRVYEKFENNDNVILLSHTIDPQHDTVGLLRDYAGRLGITSDHWLMVTGDKEEIFGVAKKYMVSAMEDKDQPGGFVHSGAFVLIDKKKQIRGYYDGTKELETNELMDDIEVLLNEG